MFSDEFDHNPFAEELEAGPPMFDARSSSSGGDNGGGTRLEKRERDEAVESRVEEGEPLRKIPRTEEEVTPAIIATTAEEEEEKRKDVDVAGPYIGYSVEEAEENDGTDDSYASVLFPIAEAEASLRQSARLHRFRVTLADQETEAIRTNMMFLRGSLREAQERRVKDCSSNSGVVAPGCGTRKEIESQTKAKENPVDFAALLKLCDGVSKVTRDGKHLHVLEGVEKLRNGVTVENRATSVDSGTWMPSSSRCEVDVSSPTPPHREETRRFESILGAIEKLGDSLDTPMAHVVTALGNEIKRLSVKSDELCGVKATLESQEKALIARWSEHALWGTERALLAAEDQMQSHLSLLYFPETEQQLFRQQQHLQKSVYRLEVVIAALLAASSGSQVKPTTPHSVQATLNRHQELEKLREKLNCQVLYLRKLLREKLGRQSLLLCDTKLAGNGKVTVEEGRTIFLQHCCASIAQRLVELTKQILLEVIKNTAARPPSPAQDERLLSYEAKLRTLHTSIVAFLSENTRLQQEIKDAALIKFMATPDSTDMNFVVERLQSLLYSKQSIGSEEETEENYGSGRKCGNEDSAEECDVQKLLVDSFTKSTDDLIHVLNAHLKRVETLFKNEKHLLKETVLFLRMIVAGDNFLFGKLGVPLPAGSKDEDLLINEVDKTHVCFKEPHKNSFQHLPSLTTIRDAFEVASRRHAEKLFIQRTEAEKKWKSLRDDVEWCRQNYSKTDRTDISEAQKELQNLRSALSAAAAREKEVASLQLELIRRREQVARLRHEIIINQKEATALETKRQQLQEKEKEEKREKEMTMVVAATSTASHSPPQSQPQDEISSEGVDDNEENKDESGNDLPGLEYPAEEEEEGVKGEEEEEEY